MCDCGSLCKQCADARGNEIAEDAIDILDKEKAKPEATNQGKTKPQTDPPAQTSDNPYADVIDQNASPSRVEKAVRRKSEGK
jgi:type II secretory pathway component PulK